MSQVHAHAHAHAHAHVTCTCGCNQYLSTLQRYDDPHTLIDTARRIHNRLSLTTCAQRSERLQQSSPSYTRFRIADAPAPCPCTSTLPHRSDARTETDTSFDSSNTHTSFNEASASTSQAGSVSGAPTLIAASFISSYIVELSAALSSLTREVFAEVALRKKLGGAGGLPGGRGGLPGGGGGPSVTAPKLVRTVGESSSPRLLCELSVIIAPIGPEQVETSPALAPERGAGFDEQILITTSVRTQPRTRLTDIRRYDWTSSPDEAVPWLPAAVTDSWSPA